MNTAWGETTVYAGPTGAAGAMGAVIEKIGEIVEDTISIEISDGTKLELKGSGGKLLDILKGEPSVIVTVDAIGLNVVSPFWKTTTSGEGDAARTVVKSLVTTEKKSIKISTGVAGSQFIEFPYCSASATVTFGETKGWGGSLSFEVLQNEAEELFLIGTNPEA